MTLTITLLILTFILSCGFLLLNILSAPEGHEDENGFHLDSGAEQSVYAAISGNQPAPVPIFAKVTTRQAVG